MAYTSQYDNKLEVKSWQQLQIRGPTFNWEPVMIYELVMMEYKLWKMGFNQVLNVCDFSV